MRPVFLSTTILLAATLAAPSAPAASPSVTYIPAAQVKTAFAKGMPLVEVASYKVHASRREAPGQAEIHVKDTDIVYVLEGRATLVTGGTATNVETTAPDEIRGTAIDGGETRRIAPGDVVIVPNGTPHWFKEVQGPLLYYVVKVASSEGGSK